MFISQLTLDELSQYTNIDNYNFNTNDIKYIYGLFINNSLKSYIIIGKCSYRRIIDYQILYTHYINFNDIFILIDEFKKLQNPEYILLFDDILYNSNLNLLNTNGFKTIGIKKSNKTNIFLYIRDDLYYGYIYKVTDLKTNKLYIGQSVEKKFKTSYFGSGHLIKKAVKARPNDFKVELLEWCKQDLSTKELYWINKLNTFYPNGYNLSNTLQNFADNSKGTIPFYQTLEGQEMCKKRNAKLIALNQTPEGKEKERKRIQALRDFYASEEGKKAKAEQVRKYKENLKNNKQARENRKKAGQKLSAWFATEEGKLQIKEQGKKLSKWFATEEGHKNLMKGIEEGKRTRTLTYINKVNALSEEEFQELVKKRSHLVKFRGKTLKDFGFE